MEEQRKYHIGFGRHDLREDLPFAVILCGDPGRTRKVATEFPGVELIRPLSENRGLASFLVRIPGGREVICATSGMGASSLSIVVNELAAIGLSRMIRVGTTGSIQDHVRAGSIIITRAALCRQGASLDIAPPEYPAAADPFLTMALVQAARELRVDWHMGVTASVDTFYEGQERTLTSANPHLLRHLRGITEEYRHLNILNFEMECGTLLKMAGVYGFAAACVCAVIDDRTTGEGIDLSLKGRTEDDAISVALKAVGDMDDGCL